MPMLLNANARDRFDPDAQVYINAIEVADGLPLEAEVKVAITRFVKGCKSDGIWNAIKASCILAGARTLAGALVPLKGAAPTNFNFVSGDYNRKTGLKGNGTTKYLNSNRANNADPQNSNHNAAWVTDAGSAVLMGAGINIAGSNNIGGLSRNRSSATLHSIVINLGLNGSSRNMSVVTYRRNQSDSAVISESEVPNAFNLIVFGRTDNSGVPSTFTASRISFYSIGESIDLALLDARVDALMNAFNAHIP